MSCWWLLLAAVLFVGAAAFWLRSGAVYGLSYDVALLGTDVCGVLFLAVAGRFVVLRSWRAWRQIWPDLRDRLRRWWNE